MEDNKDVLMQMITECLKELKNDYMTGSGLNFSKISTEEPTRNSHLSESIPRYYKS